MLADRIFLYWPVWLIGLATLVLLIGMMVLGAAARRRRDRRAEEGDEARTHEGYIVSGALGLLALLLGFTFALAVDRFDSRRGLVLEEANAIGTTYLRAQLLDEPHRSRLSRLLTGYAQNRLDLANAEDYERRAALMAQTNEYQERLWAETVAGDPAHSRAGDRRDLRRNDECDDRRRRRPGRRPPGACAEPGAGRAADLHGRRRLPVRLCDAAEAATDHDRGAARPADARLRAHPRHRPADRRLDQGAAGGDGGSGGDDANEPARGVRALIIASAVRTNN